MENKKVENLKYIYIMTNGFPSRLWTWDYNGSEQDADDGS